MEVVRSKWVEVRVHGEFDRRDDEVMNALVKVMVSATTSFGDLNQTERPRSSAGPGLCPLVYARGGGDPRESDADHARSSEGLPALVVQGRGRDASNVEFQVRVLARAP